MKRVVRGALALVAALAALPVLPMPAHAAARKIGSVQVSVDSVTPSTPARTQTPAPLSFRLTLTNTTSAALPDVSVRAERYDPISTQASLDSALPDKTPARPEFPIEIKQTRPAKVTLGADAPGQFAFDTVSSIQDDHMGLCLCANAIYPIVFTAYTTTPDGNETQLGTSVTYVPSFLNDVKPVQVSWVWPLIDRPHRLVDDAIFTDDALAGSVSGGRLDRALQVVEGLDADLPITLVLDPELLDELEVMRTGKYSIQPLAGKPTTPGTGGFAAGVWLDRLANLLATRPRVQVSLTPYADPDVQALGSNDASWSVALPTAMAARVTTALAGRPIQTDLAWPPSGAVDSHTLRTLADAGAGTVILDSRSLSPSSSESIPSSVARLTTANGPMTAVLTSPAIESDVTDAIANGGRFAAALPDLMSELAIRAVQRPDVDQFAVLTPPRYIDPVPDAAVRAIEATSTSPFSTPAAVRSAVDVRPSGASRLQGVPASTATLPATVLGGADYAADEMPSLTALLSGSRNQDAATLLAELPVAAQRVTSAAWRPGPGPFGPQVGSTYSTALTGQVDALLNGVQIVRPSSGSYTLGSSNSRLPITVDNTLDYPADVDVGVATQNGVPGFHGRDVGTQRIPAHSKAIIQIPTTVERSGRIPVQAQLRTPNGSALGKPVPLFVHTTVFGAIGVIITVVAGGVLLGALLLRLSRRMRKRKAPREATEAAS